MADADSVPSLETDPRSGHPIQNTGCGDDDNINIRTYALVTVTSPTVIGSPVYIGNCSDLTLYLRYLRGTAATDFELYWEFSDNAQTDWYRDVVWDITAGSGTITPIYSYITLTADLNFSMTIPNIGAPWIRFLMDGNATPGTSIFGLEVSRGWHGTGVVVI